MGVEDVLARLRAEAVTPGNTENPAGVTASTSPNALENLGFSGEVTRVTPVTPKNINITLDAETFGERAAMREYEGELPRAEAEVAALVDLGAHDAAALLEHLRAHGPQSYGAAATDLGWGATRTYQAQGALVRLGLIQFDDLARAAPLWWSQ